MTLVTVADVQRIMGVTDAQLIDLEITDAEILEHIYDAEAWIERYCMTAFLDNDSSLLSVSSATDDTLVFPADTFTESEYANYYVYVDSGIGLGQWKKISSNTTTTLTLASDWTTNPDNTSKAYVVYTPFIISKDKRVDPNPSITIDGNGRDTLFLPDFPLLRLESLTINSTEVTTSKVFQYENEGKLILKTTAEATIFDKSDHQLVTASYWYGSYPMPRIVKRAVGNWAAFAALIQIIGGTFDDVTSFSLPELSGSLGEPYINIREVALQLKRQLDSILPQLPVYYKFG